MPKKIVFLASGGGGTLKFLYHAIKLYKLDLEIVGILCDRHCGASEFGKLMNIETIIFENWKSQDVIILENLLIINPDYIITNIHKILKGEIIERFRNKLINLHYSLLPAYGGVIGMKTVDLAKNDNSKIIGATCHYVSEIVDGGAIISQGALCVDWNTQNQHFIENKIFQIGSIVLLNGLLSLDEKIEVSAEANSNIIFSPNLVFDNSLLNETFWAKLLL